MEHLFLACYLNNIDISCNVSKYTSDVKSALHVFWNNYFLHGNSILNIFSVKKYIMFVQMRESRYEPRHDKNNKVSVHPAKTQITQRRLRSAWASPQSDQSLLCAQWVVRAQGFFMRTAKTLIRLGGCPGWSESLLGAQPQCWFCHVAAHMYVLKAWLKWCRMICQEGRLWLPCRL